MEENTNVGRPALFRDEFIDRAYKYAMMGATDEQIAFFLGVSKDTINNWRKAYPAFADTLQNGKFIADQKVTENLYKLANGYEITEITQTTEDGHTNTETVTKKFPPNLGAIQFWLKNRQKQDWNERYQLEQAKIASQNEEVKQYSTMGKIFFITTNKQWQDYETAKATGYLNDKDQFHDFRRRDSNGNVEEDEKVEI